MSVTTPGPSIPTHLDLTEGDARTLRAGLAVFKASREKARSKDPVVAEEGAQKLLNIVCYLAGYLDAKSSGGGLNPGFQGIFQSSVIKYGGDSEAGLDEFQKSLDEALDAGTTRGLLLAGGLLLIGITLKAIANDE